MLSSDPGLIPTMLKEYGDIARDALLKYLPDQTPDRYLYNLLADYPKRGGKMMRSSLCIAVARAFGAGLDEALRSAVAIELLHNALLIHDDIEDGSLERRGGPTLHEKHGVPLAINAGDTLTLLSLQPLIENRGAIGPRLATRVLEETVNMARETAEGQAMELGWRHENTMTLDDSDYLVMVLKKTCWLGFIYPCRIGALIGSSDDVDLEPFIRLGFFVGAAFQIHDDVLNLSADRRYGKELDGDLWEGKRTLMLIHLFRVAESSERLELARILSCTRDARTAEDVLWMRGLIDRYECLEYARHFAHGLAGAAQHEFSLIFAEVPESRDKQFVKALTTWVFERTS